MPEITNVQVSLDQREKGSGEHRIHMPMPFKQLQELKVACVRYGPTEADREYCCKSLTPRKLKAGSHGLPVRRRIFVIESRQGPRESVQNCF